MEFPRLVFKCPGPLAMPGGSFAHRLVADEEQFDTAISEGWAGTLPEAIAPPAVNPAAPAGAEPTRAELEQKAAELGIKFDGRTSDRKLFDAISAKLMG